MTRQAIPGTLRHASKVAEQIPDKDLVVSDKCATNETRICRQHDPQTFRDGIQAVETEKMQDSDLLRVIPVKHVNETLDRTGSIR